MKRATLVVAVTALSTMLHPPLTHRADGETGKGDSSLTSKVEKNYVWVQVIAPGKGGWPETWVRGQWPKGLVPIVAFGNKLWMVGLGKGNKSVGYSSDGLTWNKAQSNAGWGERYGAAQAFYQNRIWVMGGTQVRNDNFRNDVWSSGDAKNWTLAIPHAGWSARSWHATLVFDDKIWVLGGMDDWGTNGSDGHLLNDVWFSTDGVKWTKVTDHAPWVARCGHISLVFDNKMWVIGGWDRNDAWYSSDGRNWTQATANAGWPVRMHNGSVAFDEKIWVFGGANQHGWLNDVWYTRDGVRWEQATAHAPWTPRFADHSTVFENKIWIFDGKYDHRYSDDVWCMIPAERPRSK